MILSLLHNPIYAGAYVFGRRQHRLRLVDGQLIRGRRGGAIVLELLPRRWAAREGAALLQDSRSAAAADIG